MMFELKVLTGVHISAYTLNSCLHWFHLCSLTLTLG